jgi:hypothetical protein
MPMNGLVWGVGLTLAFLCAVELAQLLLVPNDLAIWALML